MDPLKKIQQWQRQPHFTHQRIIPIAQSKNWAVRDGAIRHADMLFHQGVIVESMLVDGRTEEWLMLEPTRNVQGFYGLTMMVDQSKVSGSESYLMHARSEIGSAHLPGSRIVAPALQTRYEVFDSGNIVYSDLAGSQKVFREYVWQDGRMFHKTVNEYMLHPEPVPEEKIHREFFTADRDDLRFYAQNGWLSEHCLQTLGLKLLFENREKVDCTSDFQGWLAVQRARSSIRGTRMIPIEASRLWGITNRGTIGRKDGKYYEGVVVEVERGLLGPKNEMFMLRSMESQKDTNGVIMLVIDPTGNIWVQAKAEPGYGCEGYTAITTPLQSSWENIRSRELPFANVLELKPLVKVPVPQAGSEFFAKRNEFRIARLPYEFDGRGLPVNFLLASMAELREAAKLGQLSEHLAQALGLAYLFDIFDFA